MHAAAGLQRPDQGQAPGAAPSTYFRVRQDKVDETGKVSLRYNSRLYKIGLGRAHKGRHVKLLIADQNIRVIDPNGELIRELTLDPSRIDQPITHAPNNIHRCPDTSVQDVPTHHRYGARGTRTPDLLGAIQALSQLSYSPSMTGGGARRPPKCSRPMSTGEGGMVSSRHGTARRRDSRTS